MVIGKPEWFARRKYGGWGLRPKTWQGWAYIAVFMIPFIIFNAIPIWRTKTRLIFVIVWISLLIIDVFDIMRKLKQDEREKIHEAIAERNALWAMLIVAIGGILYDIVRSALEQKIYVHPFLIGILIVGAIVKAISNIYLDKKN
jgi:TctA family transporter